VLGAPDRQSDAMDSDRNLLVVIGLAVTAVIWVIALALRRVRAADLAVGARNGIVAAAILGIVVGALIVVVLPGLEPGADLGPIAISVGLTVAAIFLWLGATVMPIGFIARGGRDWARVGTWAAVAILICSFGLGYTAYKSFQEQDPGLPVPPAVNASPGAS
jgi:hypothetical protein